ncbi:histidinol-phosphate transaminase [Aquirufa aurantiipilula]|uniref:histidinol-phosphate transaminase n=1 Tax=Aquirufa aurantiipilula TaxID=2696561 RepID=UPI001CAA6D75|nr:histidinol-phosphate transaminase [Aquirufa aurantiipilula]MBZ1325406.1 histidinol-phosphate transaminase [Aquirufa aurantiipilula]
MNYQSIILPHIWNLKPYSSARDEFKGKEGVFLDANENPLGSPLSENWNRYPDPMQWEIKEELSKIKQIPVDQIFIGNGSDEAIDLIIRMTCAGQENSIILCPPTYGMYEVSASINNVNIISVALTEDYQLQVDQILKSVQDNTRIIFICSPNNPTGNKINRSDIYQIIENFQQGFVIIDEAYIDFSDEPSFITELGKFPQVIVMQTLSKAYGLASLRLGMAFAHPQIIQILNKIKPPYNIGGATQALVLAALRNRDFLINSIQQINHAKNTLISKLEAIPQVIRIFPSHANFILVKLEKTQELFDYLISQQVITRNRSNVILCESSIRITVGLAEENQVLVQKMQEFYS